MIHSLGHVADSGRCIPRESGDDPEDLIAFLKAVSYSPRERG